MGELWLIGTPDPWGATMLPEVALPESVQALILVIAFFMPGFVAGKVYELCFQREEPAEQVRLLEYVTLSCANYAFCSWIIVLVIQGQVWLSCPCCSPRGQHSSCLLDRSSWGPEWRSRRRSTGSSGWRGVPGFKHLIPSRPPGSGSFESIGRVGGGLSYDCAVV